MWSNLQFHSERGSHTIHSFSLKTRQRYGRIVFIDFNASKQSSIIFSMYTFRAKWYYDEKTTTFILRNRSPERVSGKELVEFHSTREMFRLILCSQHRIDKFLGCSTWTHRAGSGIFVWIVPFDTSMTRSHRKRNNFMLMKSNYYARMHSGVQEVHLLHYYTA